MNNSFVLAEIEKWETIFASPTQIDNTLYELAFFKIFIKFEKFLSDCFEMYSIGEKSIYGYCPERKLEFLDLEHLYKVIKKPNTSFVNQYDIIKKTSECFFIDDPFSIINKDSNYTTIINEMKTIRDYIAHESNSARNKYETNVLKDKGFIEPFEHLKRNHRKKNISYYTYYIKSIVEISKYIINQPQGG
ncbi:hypothetical protein F941_02923 [Acinetobacter bouvetii DSM 14964 = CIP 107468]|uniref:RiboL-PSP-HEPN domain-containing protein n=2 Tax=Acinetobacter bouvetii TaxID=202951 RepID=N9DLI3_9GAMM|nr:hypothetical protein F941_02923 [Acinetobacter bouvetii DSM 14964 = CIP 107468]BCU63650.1 hypothetical protein ACBO_04410 [Acinetobacter bouvetii]